MRLTAPLVTLAIGVSLIAIPRLTKARISDRLISDLEAFGVLSGTALLGWLALGAGAIWLALRAAGPPRP